MSDDALNTISVKWQAHVYTITSLSLRSLIDSVDGIGLGMSNFIKDENTRPL